QGAYARTDRPIDIVVDNFDRGLVLEGTWKTVSTAGDLGDDSLRATKAKALRGARATWRPRLSAGTYRVHAWWPADAELTTRATYTVLHDDIATEVAVDQRADGSRWVLLGTFTFAGNAAVELAARDADGA